VGFWTGRLVRLCGIEPEESVDMIYPPRFATRTSACGTPLKLSFFAAVHVRRAVLPAASRLVVMGMMAAEFAERHPHEPL
jgi:hypothetical protein